MNRIFALEQTSYNTPIHFMDCVADNEVFIKREDFIPFSFGGNKARKAAYFYQDILKNKCDCVVTYGSGSSNHCRIIANMCKAMDIPCYVVSPKEAGEETTNTILVRGFGAEITSVPVEEVHDTLECIMEKLRKQGKKPYQILGGGHGDLGTKAYVDAYEEILQYEKQADMKFDYIFHASGTGTTQAGLVCGQLLHDIEEQQIVGISIARKFPQGRNVVKDSIETYLKSCHVSVADEVIEKKLIFTDSYRLDGYGAANEQLITQIKKTMDEQGIPMDKTYVGKAFWGMNQYLIENNIKNKKILFIHTGGTPLFFNELINQ